MDWVSQPWTHLFARYKKVAAAKESTHHVATQRIVSLRSLPYALYAFSNEVCNLIRLTLDIMESLELVASGAVLVAAAGDGSMGAIPILWWSLLLSATMRAASDCITP